MDIRRKLFKGFATGALGLIAGIACLVVFPIVWLLLAVYFSLASVPILTSLTTVLTFVDVIVFLPLLIWRKTRSFGATGLLLASYVFGITLWVYGFLVTLEHWGIIGVVVGIFLVGVGVVPFGLFASVLTAHWAEFANLVYLVVLTFGSRILALWVSERGENHELHEQVIEGAVVDDSDELLDWDDIVKKGTKS